MLSLARAQNLGPEDLHVNLFQDSRSSGKFIGEADRGDVAHPELVESEAPDLPHPDRAEFAVGAGHEEVGLILAQLARYVRLDENLRRQP